jgi:hypothetical protein
MVKIKYVFNIWGHFYNQDLRKPIAVIKIIFGKYFEMLRYKKILEYMIILF